MAFLDKILGGGEFKRSELAKEDEQVLTNLEKFFSSDFKRANRAQVQAAIDDFGVLQKRAGGSSAAAPIQGRFDTLAATTSKATAFLEASQPLAEKQENVQQAVQSSPGLTRFTSLLSGLSGSN